MDYVLVFAIGTIFGFGLAALMAIADSGDDF
jgi:hypothetical protein